MKKCHFVLILWSLASVTGWAQADRIELGWQTTSRGIVWFSSAPPTHEPAWKFSRDTNKVLWVDTTRSIRYDWSYLDNVWYAKGRFDGAVPPLPQEISGSATLDNRTAFWIRDTFDLLHKYDSTANAWTPLGDFFFLSTVPADIAASGSNGAAKYRQSLWQDADDNVLYYFDGAAWTPVGGDLSITNEIQTLTAGGGGPTSYTLDLSLGGGSVTLQEGTDINLTRSGNTITIAYSGSGGGITGAENGLYVSGSNVRLGGGSSSPLIETTQIDQDGNELRIWGGGKMSVSSGTTGGYTAQNARFAVGGQENVPTTSSSSTIDAIAVFNAMNGINAESNELAIGGYTTNNDGMWIQARSYVVPNFEYPLALQPRGGQFSVGRNGGLDALATIAGSGLTGSTVSGSVLHLEHSEGHGNVPLSFGAGTDVLDAEIMWRDADDAFRITNRSNSAGTSSVRIAIGGQTSDRVIIVPTTATSLARMGVGYNSTSSIHSTLQSSGSIAAGTGQGTGSQTLDERHFYFRHTLNSTVSYTLPDPTTCRGRMYKIHHFGSSGQIGLNYNIISSTGTTFNSVPARNWAEIISDGSNWYGYLLTSL